MLASWESKELTVYFIYFIIELCLIGTHMFVSLLACRDPSGHMF